MAIFYKQKVIPLEGKKGEVFFIIEKIVGCARFLWNLHLEILLLHNAYELESTLWYIYIYIMIYIYIKGINRRNSKIYENL